MADFCAPCVDELFGPGDRGQSIRAHNDFAGWGVGPDGYAWGLCEGCGWHLIDVKGERKCGNRPRIEAAAERGLFDQCKECQPDG